MRDRALLVTVGLLFLSTATAEASGLSISKVGSYKDESVSDPRFDAIICRVSWKTFQPTSSATTDTTYLDNCAAAAATNHKVAIMQLDFAPDDMTVNETATPQWAVTAGVKVVSDPGVTNIYPVWWNTTFKTLAKGAITKLTDLYDADARVAGYFATGFAGVLPTSLAGEYSDELCDDFKAEGLTGTCEETAQTQTIASGSVYGPVVREMLAHWAISTSKPVAYVSRPLDRDSLAVELEADPVALYPHIAVINNGFRDCEGIRNDIIPRWQTLQAAGHIVGWNSIAVNGFPIDGNGDIVPGELARALQCAVDDLDETNLWFALAPVTWYEHEDAIDALYFALHPDQMPQPPLPPTGVQVN
jgi:hypothetical protein